MYKNDLGQRSRMAGLGIAAFTATCEHPGFVQQRRKEYPTWKPS